MGYGEARRTRRNEKGHGQKSIRSDTWANTPNLVCQAFPTCVLLINQSTDRQTDIFERCVGVSYDLR